MSRLSRRPRILAAAALALPVLVFPIRGHAQAPVPAPASDRVVTVFTGGFGQVWERRPLTPQAGPRDLVLDGISHRTLAESLRLAGDGGDIAVQSLSLSRNLLTPRALLERFLGKEVGVVKVHPTTGEEKIEKATVLSVQNGVVLRMGGRIETGMPGRLVFPDDLGGLSARPVLTARITAGAAARGLTLTYLTEGLSWATDYTAVVAPDGGRVSLTGWASMQNDTGVALDTARLRLVAGEVNRAMGTQPMAKAPRTMMMAEARGAAADAALPVREAQGAVHVYTLAGAQTLAAGERKQVALLGPVEVPVSETLLSLGHPQVFGPVPGGTTPDHPQVRLSFDNKSLVAGGLPLPGGVVRAYRTASDGQPLFVGSDRISDTPDGGRVIVTLGRAFDVTVKREQTAFKRLDAQGRNVEAAFKITVANGRAKPARVRIAEVLPGDWTITENSLVHERSGDRARWLVEVPGKGELVLTYKVRVLR
ncbi:MAG: DUF4139 domain-containing protein [Magnetovibrio sp.]|nr:DUF4139 domain-containing protein [Magnetovibrio sp.]